MTAAPDPPAATFDRSLFDLATATLTAAEWAHTDLPSAGTIGTAILVDGRMIGGSLGLVGTVATFLAFGGLALDDDADLGALADLCARSSALVPDGAFELHPLLGPAFRVVADLAGLGPEAASERLLEMATTATGRYVRAIDAFELVLLGAEPAAVLAVPELAPVVGSEP